MCSKQLVIRENPRFPGKRVVVSPLRISNEMEMIKEFSPSGMKEKNRLFLKIKSFSRNLRPFSLKSCNKNKWEGILKICCCKMHWPSNDKVLCDRRREIA